LKKVTYVFLLMIFMLSGYIIPMDSASAATKQTLSIKEKNVSITIGEKKKLTLVSNKKLPSIKWVSNNPSILSVDAKGIVLGKKVGKVIVTASNSKLKLKATTTVTVKPPAVINVSKITTSEKNVVLREGESVQVSATILPSNATNKNIIWSSNNTSIADVDQDGTIYALKEGFTTVKVTSENKKVSNIISVKVTAITDNEEEEPQEPNVKEIIKNVSNSVVYIEAYNKKGEAVSSGSGFVFSADGLIATNHHVVTDEEESIESVKIKFVDGTVYSTDKLVGYDEKNDLAIVKVDYPNGWIPTKLGNSDGIEVGDKIITIGSPLGLDNTVSEGIISNKNRVMGDVSYIQISAPISHGSSGGVLINEKGEVIGVTSAGMENGQNLNFAIPVNRLKSVTIGAPVPLLSIQKVDNDLLTGRQEIVEEEPNNQDKDANLITHEEFNILGSINGQYDLDNFQFTINSSKDFLLLASVEPKYSYLTSELLVGIFDTNDKVVLIATDYYGDDGTLYRKVEGTLPPGTYYLSFFGDTETIKSLWSLNPIYYAAGKIM
jgi:hypothetical protein